MTTHPNPIAAIAALWPEQSGRSIAALLGYSQAQWQAWTSGRVSPTVATVEEVLRRASVHHRQSLSVVYDYPDGWHVIEPV